MSHKLLRFGIALPFLSFLVGWYYPVVVLVCSVAGLFIGIADVKNDRRLAWICIGINLAFIILYVWMFYSLYRPPITNV